jgi:hypothetical protein
MKSRNPSSSKVRVEHSLAVTKYFILILLLSASTGWKQNNEHSVKQGSPASTRGTIMVDIREAGFPAHYWQYVVRPSDGAVTRVSEQRFRSRQDGSMPRTYAMPAGAIDSCTGRPEAISPDGKFVAACEASPRDRASFVIIEHSTKKELMRWTPEQYRGIRGFAWSPDSRSVAVLNENEHYGKSPLELLSGLSGHPVPHNTVFVDLFVADEWKFTEYVVRKNVINAFTRILDWKQ